MGCRTPCSSVSGELFMAYLALPTDSVTLNDCNLVSTASHPAPHQLWITAITTHPDLPAPYITLILAARKFRKLTRRKKKIIYYNSNFASSAALASQHQTVEDKMHTRSNAIYFLHTSQRHLFLFLSFVLYRLTLPSVFLLFASRRHGSLWDGQILVGSGHHACTKHVQ
jgi:hypothetical protein